MTKLRPTKDLLAAFICALAFFALAILPVASAKAEKFLVTWKNPAYSGPKPRRILVIGMSENPEIRLDFEDDLSAAITGDGLEAVPGNSILLRTDSPIWTPIISKDRFATSRSTP